LVSFTSKAAGQTCSLCPDGSSIEDPTRDFLGFATCGESEELLSGFATGGTCDELVPLLNLVFDQTAFCCSNVDPQEGLCPLCGDGGSLTNPDVTIFNLATCSDLFTASTYIVNQTVCEGFQAAGPACCSGESTCQLCPNGGEIAFPDKAVPFQNFTCAELDQVILFTTEDDCAEVRDFLVEDINFLSWCGCTGVETPDECFLCGPDEEISDPDAIIPELDGLTCEVFAELARHVVNETLCENEVNMVVDLCCRPKSTPDLPVGPTTAPAGPTAAPAGPTAAPAGPTAAPAGPTAAPVGPTESSAPGSKSVVALTSGMLMAGTMIMLLV
jgi:hypothetical protein